MAEYDPSGDAGECPYYRPSVVILVSFFSALPRHLDNAGETAEELLRRLRDGVFSNLRTPHTFLMEWKLRATKTTHGNTGDRKDIRRRKVVGLIRSGYRSATSCISAAGAGRWSGQQLIY
jgi:hypothetical protein